MSQSLRMNSLELLPGAAHEKIGYIYDVFGKGWSKRPEHMVNGDQIDRLIDQGYVILPMGWDSPYVITHMAEGDQRLDLDTRKFDREVKRSFHKLSYRFARQDVWILVDRSEVQRHELVVFEGMDPIRVSPLGPQGSKFNSDTLAWLSFAYVAALPTAQRWPTDPLTYRLLLEGSVSR